MNLSLGSEEGLAEVWELWALLGVRGGYWGGGVRKCYFILTGRGRWARDGELLRFHAMSEEQLTALLAKLKEDAGLREKLKGAADLDAAVAMAQESGFDVRVADWLKYEANQATKMSDGELEVVAGGVLQVSHKQTWRWCCEPEHN